MARSAKRRSLGAATARNIARREQEEFAQQLRRKIASGIQGSAIAIMNELAEAGPAWSGEFSASWKFVPEGGSITGDAGPEGRIYRYGKSDVPVNLVEKYMKGGKTGPSAKLADVVEFQIVNTAPHANIAIDAEIGVLRRDYAESRGWPEPLKDPVLGTERNNPDLRYQIGDRFSGSFDDAPASRTAEPDWYLNYLQGGGLQRDLGKGFSIGLRTSFR